MDKVLLFIKTYKKAFIALAIVIVIALGIVVVKNVGKNNLTEEERIKQSIEKIARKYYEDLYYPDIGSTDDIEQKKGFLNYFTLNGIRFHLKNIVNYKNEINYNDNVEYKNPVTNEDCDLDKTIITITPKEPFGKTDYTISVSLECGF